MAVEAGPSPARRSKLSSAVAEASARWSKSEVFRRSSPLDKNLNNTHNENAINHEDAKPTSQDPPANLKQQIKAKPLPSQPQQHFANMILRRKEHKSRPLVPSSSSDSRNTSSAVPVAAAAATSQPKSVPKPAPIHHNTGINRNNRNMVQRKSHQRLILEQMAAKYFLNNTGNSGTGRAAGGDAHTPLGLTEEKDAVAMFLDILNDDNATAVGHIGDSESNSDKSSSAISSSVDDDKSTTQRDAILAVSPNRKKSSAEQIEDIEEESNIDMLLEMASNHLSLGKNELALQAYRRAMKRAFADVMSVKSRLEEIKKKQAELLLKEESASNGAGGGGSNFLTQLLSPSSKDNVDVSELELSKKQELEFELSLLQVASRVADIHNNMGVVHEMNRSYKKAKAAYCDALDVYHNTCKRFENSDDPDVDRTYRNVERMQNACESEEQFAALHEKASKIVKQAHTSDHASRDKALTAAVVTLKQALKIEVDTVGSTHPVVANTLIQLGKYYYEMREFDAAVSVIRQAIGIYRNALGKNHPQVCKSVLLLASIYERHGQKVSPKGVEKDEVELELYVDSLEPLKSSLGEVHTEVALVYTKIGYLYGKKDDLSLSLLAYKAALKAYGEPSSTSLLGGVHPEVASIWVRVTEHLYSMKCWEDVVVAGRRALFYLRLVKKSFFGDVERHSSSSSNSATASLSLSLPVLKTSKKSAIQITPATYYTLLNTTLTSLGQAHIALNNYQLARDACHESLQYLWEMALSSQHESNSSNSMDPLDPAILLLVRGLKRLGKVLLLQKHYNDALDCFLPCLELLRASKTTESSLDCASVLGSIGFLYLKLHRFTESSNFLRECLRLYHRNGVDVNDREISKVKAWLDMSESREDGFEEPPTFLEIPIVI
jgi:tetratricopeptide (TPR) repeat protein